MNASTSRFRCLPGRLATALTALLLCTAANAALFEDDEARKAILDLRQRVEAMRLEVEQAKQAASNAVSQETAGLNKGQLELHSQIELLRAELAGLRGANEKLTKDLTDLQLQLRNDAQTRLALEDRLAQLEPSKVTVDGVEFMAEPAEKREFESALAVFRRGDFLGAQNQFVGFLSRYPASGYTTQALFWLGNAQYATRDYKEAITNFRSLIARSPQHVRAPEAVLSVANCQLELKDAKGARKTLTDLIKAYPQSEAAAAAKERLAALK
ncbi:MAG: tol-pal system protein YbgF [Comamonadaceae bacterium CG1_02_60_18]|nr:MAG: tol-pal system protein YbgF [Comamonadaceae bacterium CG1_02_60_18]PIQ51465.1 MAG: tol-pal system protein YbgF [Comamonadaceae bacterium CG12_big_fil_rev_8_21_14_0_65_59_15]